MPIELIPFISNLFIWITMILIISVISYFVLKLAIRNALNEHDNFKNKY